MMKNYIKPELNLSEVKVENIASLTDWLANNAQEYEGVGITTYILAS